MHHPDRGERAGQPAQQEVDDERTESHEAPWKESLVAGLLLHEIAFASEGGGRVRPTSVRNLIDIINIVNLVMYRE
jgi:hypothetical protein